MVKSDAKRQQKLARKQAKDRKRHQTEARKRQQLASLHGVMSASAGGNIKYCGIGRGIVAGLGYVALVRQAPDGQLAMFLLLVDTYCLGVKQALGGLRSGEEVRDLVERINMESVDPSVARGLVESAIEFALQAGLKPHPDYEKVAPLWGGIPRGSIEGRYPMGLDGKHAYMPGPLEGTARQLTILNTLAKYLGEGNVRLIEPASDESLEDSFDDDAFDNDDLQDSDSALQVTQHRIDQPNS